MYTQISVILLQFLLYLLFILIKSSRCGNFKFRIFFLRFPLSRAEDCCKILLLDFYVQTALWNAGHQIANTVMGYRIKLFWVRRIDSFSFWYNLNNSNGEMQKCFPNANKDWLVLGCIETNLKFLFQLVLSKTFTTHYPCIVSMLRLYGVWSKGLLSYW